jgi:hypothetical protein
MSVISRIRVTWNKNEEKIKNGRFVGTLNVEKQMLFRNEKKNHSLAFPHATYT